MNKAFVALLSAVLAAGTLSGCGTPSEAEIAEKTAPPDHAANQVMPAHRDVNQQPTPVFFLILYARKKSGLSYPRDLNR